MKNLTELTLGDTSQSIFEGIEIILGGAATSERIKVSAKDLEVLGGASVARAHLAPFSPPPSWVPHLRVSELGYIESQDLGFL